MYGKENNLKITEDALYEQAYLEIHSDQKIISTWARCIAEAKGDASKTEGLYIERRVKELKTAIKDNYDMEQAKAKTEAEAAALAKKEAKAAALANLREERAAAFVNSKNELSQRRDDETISDYISRRSKNI